MLWHPERRQLGISHGIPCHVDAAGRLSVAASKRWQSVMRWILRIGVAVSAALIPLATISTVVLGLFHDSAFYHAGQLRYQVSTVTGLTQDQMDRVDNGIVRFFFSSDSLSAAIGASGGPINVFNERETLHMNDVRDVIRAFSSLQVISLVTISLFIVLAGSTWAKGGRAALARGLVLSSIVTIAIGVVAIGLTFVGFDSLFITFHEITFHNDFWQLDPRTDHLVQMFPFEFWYDTMLDVALRVVVVTVILGAAGIALSRVGVVERRRV
jgi:integral membrane protein (TIGR01906 family)